MIQTLCIRELSHLGVLVVEVLVPPLLFFMGEVFSLAWGAVDATS